MMRSLKKAMYWQSGLRLPVVEKSHAFSQHIPEIFERDMGYNEKEFFRVLPAAVGEYQFSRNENSIEITHHDNQHLIKLDLSALPDRLLGSIRIQRMGVQFSFSNMDDKERRKFMQRFDSRFQRGGG